MKVRSVLVQLEAEGFRNLESLNRDFEPGAHLFLGDNGAGKTSLLEAVYLLATTRSFRTPRIADCCRHGGERFRLGGEVLSDRRTRLDLGWEAGSRRTVNGQQATLAEHLAVLPVACWTSADAEILVGPPAERRQLLDRGVVSGRPAAIAAISRYRRALGQKRQLLLQGGGELSTWNRVLAEAAAELIALRSAYAEKLGGALAEVLEESRLGFPPIELRYRASPRSAQGGADAIEEELAAVEGRERRLQQALLGPHRDDLVIRWDGHQIRRVASAGERKALGLALLAAQGQILETAERSPIYLLDDADTELDRRRLESLWRVFGGCGQLFLTSNRPAVWEEVEIAHRWRLRDGRVAAE